MLSPPDILGVSANIENAAGHYFGRFAAFDERREVLDIVAGHASIFRGHTQAGAAFLGTMLIDY